MNLIFKKILAQFTKVLGIEKTPPPPFGKNSQKIPFFLGGGGGVASLNIYWRKRRRKTIISRPDHCLFHSIIFSSSAISPWTEFDCQLFIPHCSISSVDRRVKCSEKCNACDGERNSSPVARCTFYWCQGEKWSVFVRVTIRIPTVIIPTFIMPTVGIMNDVCRYFEIAP